jgi:hypothetical protein
MVSGARLAWWRQWVVGGAVTRRAAGCACWYRTGVVSGGKHNDGPSQVRVVVVVGGCGWSRGFRGENHEQMKNMNSMVNVETRCTPSKYRARHVQHTAACLAAPLRTPVRPVWSIARQVSLGWPDKNPTNARP